MKRIAITGAAGQIAYSVIFRAAQGDLFGKEPISLALCDLAGTERVLEAIAMELEDCAFPLLNEVRVGSDPEALFMGAELVLLLGAKPRSAGMERGDLLQENGAIFVTQGKAINASAHPDAKVIVVGNPCNTNCLIAMHHAPRLARRNFHALMRLDQLRATAQLAKKASVPSHTISCMTVWGNHSTTQVVDFTHARIRGRLATEVISDRTWLQQDFFEKVQQRGAEILRARGKSSAASAAHAVVEAVKSLYTPTPSDDWFTSAICSDQNPYGIEEDLIFGFPCQTTTQGDYQIVEQLSWDCFMREKIAITQKELLAERDCVRALLKR